MVSKESKGNLKLFTQRELEILDLIAEGSENDEIAERLHIRVRSVVKHEINLLNKMNAPDMSFAIEYGLKKRLINITYA